MPAKRDRQQDGSAQKKSSANSGQKKGVVRQFPSREQRQQKEPEPPFPKQHQPKPGLESKLQPKPKYSAPAYRGS